MSLKATYFGSSSWFLEFGQFSILVDPWLKGNLSFSPGPWLIEGRLKKELKVPNKINLILLTQGLADHAHPQSLDLLPRSIPVIGSFSAAKLVTNMGFQSVYGLKPGEMKEIGGLTIQATAGALVPKLENGYMLFHEFGSLYLEPHGFLDANLPTQHLDAVITPVVNIKLPLFGSFIQGKEVLPNLLKLFNPLTVLASTTGGDATFTGFLNRFMSLEGSPEQTKEMYGKEIVFINPDLGSSYKLKTYK